MATVWLGPDEVAERLGVARRTAISLMYQMPYSVISGTERKRIRVSEETLDSWVMKRTNGKPLVTKSVGSKRRLERR